MKLNTLNKIKSIIGDEIEENETNSTSKLNLKKKENNKPSKLNLKIKTDKTNGINQDSLNLTTEKFHQIEKMVNKMNSIETSFNSFLSSQNETIEQMNTWNKQIDTMELIFTNLLKNQKSILDGINGLHAKLFQVEKSRNEIIEEAKNSVKEQTNKTILRKKEDKKEESEIDIELLFNTFQSHFGNKAILGDIKLNTDNGMALIQLIESIDDKNRDTIIDSIKKFRSKYYKENKKLLTAKKSNSSFEIAMIKTIEELTGNSFSIEESKQNSETIDKAYFAKLFDTDIVCISELIEEITSNLTDDNQEEIIESIENFLSGLKENITDNQIGLFFKYAKSFIE